MSVQIQCKSLNQKTDINLKVSKYWKGKEWTGLVFPHPTILKNQLAKHLVKLAIRKLGLLLGRFK